MIVTPHIGEMSRLTGVAIPDIKKNILEVCKDFSMEYNVVSALKDARTCVSDGRDVYINTSGNNGMSTAGAGDVLAGIIAGLVCTGLGAYEAAEAGSIYTWVGRRYGGRAQRKKCNDSQGYSERYIGGYKRSRT